MLAYLLAIAVGGGSFALYATAFLFPKLHRQDDFLWSGVGLLYALVLWVCADRLTGGLLLGQTASVALLGWFVWEMLRLRQAIADPSRIPDLDRVSLVATIRQRFPRKAVVPIPSEPTTPAPLSTDGEAKDLATEIAEETDTPFPEGDRPTPVATVAPELEPEIWDLMALETVEAPSPSPDIDELSPAPLETEGVLDTIATPPTEEPAIAPVPDIDELSPVPPETEGVLDTIATPPTEEPAIAPVPEPSSPDPQGFTFGRMIGRVNPFRRSAEEPPKSAPQDSNWDDEDWD